MKHSTMSLVVGTLVIGLIACVSIQAGGEGRFGGGPPQGHWGPPDHSPGRGFSPGGPPAGSHGGFGGPAMQGGFLNHPEVQKKLGLTDDQISKIKAIHRENEKKKIRHSADLEIARIELEETLRSDEIDKSAIDELVDRMGELHKQQIRGSVDHLLAVREVLDATQIEKISGFVDRFRGFRGGPGQMHQRGDDRKWRGPDRHDDKRGYEDRDRKRGDRRDGHDRNDRRPDGPPPREGKAPLPGPPPHSYGFMNEMPNDAPHRAPESPRVQEDLANIGPSIEFFLDMEG